nr:hypothetical protein Ade03nite_37230 [Actinoplanes derwentensis]
MLMPVALAAVLLTLAAYVIQGTVHTTRATSQQGDALVVDMLFTEARIAVAMQEVNLRHYQVEPSVAVKQRFDQVAAGADRVLAEVAGKNDQQARADAGRLRAAQTRYRKLAEQLITMVADSDPESIQLDRLEVTPAFYSLQNDVDEVSRAYHEYAQQQVSALRLTQVRLLFGTSAGFAIGLILVAMILKMVVGYQRRLVDQATESRHRSLHDPLTGLPNRDLFHRELSRSLAAAPVAMMVIDLDGFKAVNDTLGHQAGDLLLIETGRRLSTTVADHGLVSRLGGDEFAVLLPHATLPEAAELAGELVAVLRHEFLLNGSPATISGSLGIALAPAGADGDELFRHADAAMYHAKTTGGGVATHDPDHHTRDAQRRAS